MAFMTWDPFRELEALRREVDRAFEDYGVGDRPSSRFSFLPGVSARTYPLLNVNEDNDNIYVQALAPGLDTDSLEISVQAGALRIAGEKAALNADIKPEAFHRRERAAGRFTRTLNLATEVDADKVGAAYKNGLLEITLPKAEKAKAKQIKVDVK